MILLFVIIGLIITCPCIWMTWKFSSYEYWQKNIRKPYYIWLVWIAGVKIPTNKNIAKIWWINTFVSLLPLYTVGMYALYIGLLLTL